MAAPDASGSTSPEVSDLSVWGVVHKRPITILAWLQILVVTSGPTLWGHIWTMTSRIEGHKVQPLQRATPTSEDTQLRAPTPTLLHQTLASSALAIKSQEWQRISSERAISSCHAS